MKSFTASTRLGLAKVHLPDLTPGQPSVPTVIQSGVILASGIPTSVEGPALSFETDGEPLVCVPQGQVEIRHLTSIDGEEGEWAATRWPGVFAIDGRPIIWGAKLGRQEASIRGFVFEEGGQMEVNLSVAITPIRRACCGRR